MIVLEKLNSILKTCHNADDRTVIKLFKTNIEGLAEKSFLTYRDYRIVKKMLNKLYTRNVIDFGMLQSLLKSIDVERIEVEDYRVKLSSEYKVDILTSDHYEHTLTVTDSELKEWYIETGQYEWTQQGLDNLIRTNKISYDQYTEFISKHEMKDFIERYLNDY